MQIQINAIQKQEVRVGTLERTVCSSPKMDGNCFATESVASHHILANLTLQSEFNVNY